MTFLHGFLDRRFTFDASRASALCAVLLMATLGAGCDATVTPPRPDPPETLTVYAVVDAARTEQRAVVTRVTAVDANAFRYEQDADVGIAGRSLAVIPEDSIDTIQNVFGLDRNANYVVQNLRPDPGQTVRLQVDAGGKTLTGKTTVPGAFDGTVDSLTVRWTPSPGAARYVLEVERLGSEDEWRYRHETSATEAAIPTDTGFEPGPHRLVVTAVDSNLVRYQESVVRVGVEGGYGVFGSVNRIGSPQIQLPAASKSLVRAQPRGRR